MDAEIIGGIIGEIVFIIMVIGGIVGSIVLIRNNIKEKEELSLTEKKSNIAKSTAASTLKAISTIVIIITVVIGGAIGYYISWVIDDDVKLVGVIVGAIIGLILGFLGTLFVRYFAELGENTKKVANATMEQAGKTSDIHADTVVNELLQLKKLLDQGVITQEEFETQKNKILNK